MLYLKILLCSVFCNELFVIFQAVNCKGQHSISYTLSRNKTVVVEYSHDTDTDMFQVKNPLEDCMYGTFQQPTLD